MKRLLPFLLLLAACGDSPPAQPGPVQTPRTPTDARPSGGTDSVRDETAAAESARAGIEVAATAEDARKARAQYTGGSETARLDRVLAKKLMDIEFAQYNEVVAGIQQTKTPTDATTAAKAYTGELYRKDLELALEQHISALIKKDPSLKRPGAATPAKPVQPGTSLESLFANCTTETEAAAARAAYKGPGSESDVLAALERWRWTSPELISTVEGDVKLKRSSRFVRLSDGRLVAAMEDAVKVLKANGETQFTLVHASGVATVLLAVSPDEKFGYTSAGTNPAVQKWDLATGKRVLSFAAVESELTTWPDNSVLLPDGSGLVTSSRSLTLWDTQTGKFVRHFATIKHSSVVASGDSKTVYLATLELLRAYDVESGNVLIEFKLSGSTLLKPAMSPDNSRIAYHAFISPPVDQDGIAGPREPHLVTRDAATAAELARVEWPEFIDRIYWLDSGQHLLVCGQHGYSLVDPQSLKVIATHKFAATGVHLNRTQQELTVSDATTLSVGGKVLQPFSIYGRKP